jgi:transglutaminase-like putative cysteine protease
VARYLKRAFALGELSYIPDPAGCDLWYPPAVTLWRGGGDCDDLSSLSLSLLRAMGLRSADLVVGTHCDGRVCDGHAWVEGRDRFGHFLLEATNGTLLRGGRPWVYHAQYRLCPGRCLDVRDTHARLAAA